MPNTQKRLTPAQHALAINMYAVQGKTQAEVAEHFDVTQASISRLVRKHFGTEQGKHVVRTDPGLPGDTLKQVRDRLSDHIYEADKVLKAMRATMSLLQREPNPTVILRNGQPVYLHETFEAKTARLCANPTKEDGPYWMGDAILFERERGGSPYWTVEEWANEHPGTFVYVERGDGVADEVWTVEHALEVWREQQNEAKPADSNPSFADPTNNDPDNLMLTTLAANEAGMAAEQIAYAEGLIRAYLPLPEPEVVIDGQVDVQPVDDDLLSLFRAELAEGADILENS